MVNACNAGSMGLIPGQGTKVPHASRSVAKKKIGTRKKNLCKNISERGLVSKVYSRKNSLNSIIGK